MNILFVHNNFPAQFRHVVRELLDSGSHRLAAICASTAVIRAPILIETYDPPSSTGAHVFARRFDLECQRAERVLYAAMRLKTNGFIPDVIVAHSGWGETLPLREVFPFAKIIVYCEFYYRSRGLDVGFDPEFPEFGLDGNVAINIKNATQLLSLADADIAVSPTKWQRSTYPDDLQDKILVIHEGVDTVALAPDTRAAFYGVPGRVFRPGDEVVTFVSRSLEPLRGLHTFLRALPGLLARRPQAQIVLVGGEGVSYGAAPSPPFKSWRDVFWQEVAPHVDAKRVHFAGRLSYSSYISLLQISAAHVYMTYPFVLSWSLLEAMSVGCAIIGSDTPPVTEVLSEQTGRIVPFFNPNLLADGIEMTIVSQEDTQQLRQNARQFTIDNYDMATVCRPAFLKLLETI